MKIVELIREFDIMGININDFYITKFNMVDDHEKLMNKKVRRYLIIILK